MALDYRIPKDVEINEDLLDKIHQGDSLEILKKLPSNSVSLAITSPPYWNVKDYEHPEQIGQTSYEMYLDELLKIWKETERVLIPNGKLVIQTPILPLSKAEYDKQHTRHIKNINNDIEQTILNGTGFERFSLYIWQKQTSVKMFGSYPFPPNLYEDNTIEFINVFVKEGKPPKVKKEAKQASKLSQDEWRNLTMQVWPIYPADVQRAGGHPAPFPVVLPQRLIMMYSFAMFEEEGFGGDIVLDMFNGTGATCVAAKALKRRYIGIDLNEDYCKIAEDRLGSLHKENFDPYDIMLSEQRVKKAKNSRQGSLF